MVRTLRFVAACLFVLVFCMTGHTQDSPSLGDLARQAQKNKTNAPVKKVFTNDDLPSGSSSGNGLTSSGLGTIGAPAPAGKPSEPPTPEQAMGQMEALINQIDSLDRAALVKGALQGVESNFPGRSRWETRLFSAKQTYVAQGRDLIQKIKQLEASVGTLKGVQDPNDPRVKDLSTRLQSLIQDGTRADAAFQAVILEGRDLAAQASAH